LIDSAIIVAYTQFGDSATISAHPDIARVVIGFMGGTFIEGEKSLLKITNGESTYEKTHKKIQNL
jgi:NADPH-dependent 7-cyano-7-deazaguanine reductase QueF